MFQKLPHFGEYQKKREAHLQKLYKESLIKDEIILHHSGLSSGYTDGRNNQLNSGHQTPKVKDIIGRALPRIGAYKKLDNRKQVVALIDDVSFF